MGKASKTLGQEHWGVWGSEGGQAEAGIPHPHTGKLKKPVDYQGPFAGVTTTACLGTGGHAQMIDQGYSCPDPGSFSNTIRMTF